MTLKYDDETEAKIKELLPSKCREILLRKDFYWSNDFLAALNCTSFKDSILSILNYIDAVDLKISVDNLKREITDAIKPIARAELVDEIMNEKL